MQSQFKNYAILIILLRFLQVSGRLRFVSYVSIKNWSGARGELAVYV